MKKYIPVLPLELTWALDLLLVDIVFPASTRLEEALAQHVTTNVRTRSRFAPFVHLVQDKIDGLEFRRFVFSRRVAPAC